MTEALTLWKCIIHNIRYLENRVVCSRGINVVEIMLEMTWIQRQNISLSLRRYLDMIRVEF